MLRGAKGIAGCSCTLWLMLCMWLEYLEETSPLAAHPARGEVDPARQEIRDCVGRARVVHEGEVYSLKSCNPPRFASTEDRLLLKPVETLVVSVGEDQRSAEDVQAAMLEGLDKDGAEKQAHFFGDGPRGYSGALHRLSESTSDSEEAAVREDVGGGVGVVKGKRRGGNRSRQPAMVANGDEGGAETRLFGEKKLAGMENSDQADGRLWRPQEVSKHWSTCSSQDFLFPRSGIPSKRRKQLLAIYVEGVTSIEKTGGVEKESFGEGN
ncbi:hypothetical protein BDK51DRAFT_27127 [Blyttiomyces helicus]|uniref:Uncharacterized protein n=1 Tax=Blyttiomyces helicus TaxID=388810 RepID=A0A4V1IRW7_9FUNG|nr:hypothetical protein BDK51DRAFT_27127 [Blyttiomyces helicus]|eukprot:RKO91497.1 hypothetical protein BDK51DRAFT_27127 [Blyttiomyces helicus]